MSSREQLRRFDVIGAIALASVLALALASSACALLVETDDLTDSPKTDAAASPPRTPRAPSDAGDGATSATDPNGDPGTGSTDPGGTNGGNDAAPATRDDDAGASTDGGASTDAAPKSGIACGSETCVPGASVCCYAFDAGPIGCATSCAPSQITLPCDDTADCTATGHPGNFCCITIGPAPDFHATGAQCAATCPATGGTTPFCDNHDNQHTCPKGTSCQSSTLNVPGYHVCK